MTDVHLYLDIIARLVPETFERYQKVLLQYFEDNIQLTETTLRRYAYTLCILFRYLEEHKIPLGEITVSVMNQFFNYRRENCQLRTVNNQFNILFRFLEHLSRKRVISASYWKNLAYQRSRYPQARGSVPREIFQHTDPEQILQTIDDPRSRMVIWILHHYALRPGELSRLKDEDIDLQNRRLVVHESKHHRSRFIPIPPRHVLDWEDWFEQKGIIYPLSPYVIPNKTRHYSPLSVRQIENIVQKTSEVLSRRVYPYLFRRSTATFARRRGVPLETLRDILGHSNIAVTNIYINPLKEDIESDWVRYKNSEDSEEE